MSKKNRNQSTNVESTNVESTIENTENTNQVVEETPKINLEPKIKETPVEERQYRLVTTEGEPLKFRGKQRQTIYDVLRGLENPSTISQVTEVVETKEFKAVGGTEPSVRYHLHHMTKDGITEVVNPTITLE